MGGSYEVRNAPDERTIRIRMTGRFDARKMSQWAEDYARATDSYGGKPHLILADMRGMSAALPEVGHIMGEAIRYARARGVYCCVHLSDDTIQRLQAARLGRQAAVNDDVTVDVVSLEEAERVLDDARQRLRGGASAEPDPKTRTG